MPLEFHQVDAFTDQPFAGNPAMVYRLDAWLDEPLMQRIAAEHNLAETAFVVKEGEAWHIRWFTPTSEVPLCGHATLASAKVLFDLYHEAGEVLQFTCLSGALRVTRQGQRLELDFPLRPVVPVAASLQAEVERALDQPAHQVLALLDADGSVQELMVVLASEAQVRGFAPNLPALAELPGLGVLITAPGERHDFVSRYFAPSIGIDEDPVTGSTHCMLAPYWAERLGRSELSAFQCSARGGELLCRLDGARVKIAGHARHIASGRLML
ncbi:MAG: PhzF family phenazine biosynthesis protein [Ectopseudomonas guguanensis]|jgi:PhzF family phenazine biosynthesis protein|uniref:Phenazine biosynthesis protein PhzF family n=1 Tax=Ectopseudomonas guguanensis TaxID=1198456 RepID=A0A1H0X6D8_9GAMM|nr:PhzF family phenazine biosynthesis protein [Pseudomonas guguanensis]SDP98016.1 phenazine biosynthesis protein PhzF family [Pseudomonas guguanensis]